MNRILFSGLVLALTGTIAPVSALAAPFDGSNPMVCASIHATECTAEAQECVSGAPWMINFPVFTEIDFKSKKLSTTDIHVNGRVSDIEDVSHLPNGQLSIHGDDADYAWSMLVSEETGAMTLTVSGDEVGFIVFGACTLAR